MSIASSASAKVDADEAPVRP